MSATTSRLRRLSPGVRLYVTVALLITFGLLTFSAGILTERYLLPTATVRDTRAAGPGSGLPPDTRAGLENFYEVLRLVEDEYYYRPIDRQKMLHGATRGLLSTLGDDYTTFLEPVQQQGVREAMSGDYEGIGVYIEIPEGRHTIAAPIRDSPAEAAGLRARDVIVRVDGHEITGLATDEVLKLVRGKTGTVVRLSIQRPGLAETLEVEVTRGVINIPSVQLRMLDGDIALIGVSIFGDKTTDQLDGELRNAREAGARAIILDLRNNGGGWVVSAQEMLGRFVDPARGPALLEDKTNGAQARALLRTPTPAPAGSGTPTATPPASPPTLDTRDAKRDPILAGDGDTRLYDIPLVVLINGGTASASEIVVGALQDYGRATTIGTRTFGKGSIQSVHEFDDDSSARITIAQWLTPEGRIIQGRGLTPDLVVEQPQSGEDAQLARALAFLREGR